MYVYVCRYICRYACCLFLLIFILFVIFGAYWGRGRGLPAPSAPFKEIWRYINRLIIIIIIIKSLFYSCPDLWFN